MEQFIRTCLEPDGRLARAFLNYEFRPQQLEMALDVAATLQSETGIFIAEAGTGTGKSLAYLIPAAAMKRHVIISTGTKNLQEQLMKNDIPLLNTILDRAIYAVLIKGRQNYLCLRRFELFSDHPEFSSVKEKKLWQSVVDWAVSTDTGDSAEMDFLPDYSPLWKNICTRRDDCMGVRCPYYSSCFLLRLKIKAQAADMVVVNHHLYFADVMLRQKSSVSALPDTHAVIFDEAHLLEEIVTQFLGAHLGQGDVFDFTRLIRRWKPERKDLGKAGWGLDVCLKQVEEGAVLFFNSMPSGEGRFDFVPMMKEEVVRLGNVFIERLDSLRGRLDGEGLIPAEFIVEWKEICRNMANAVRLFMDHSEPGMAWWGEHTNQGNYLHAGPVDISGDFLSIISNPVRPVILTSATLTTDSTFDFLVSRLGLQRSENRIYPSPFDFAQQGIMYMPVHLPNPNSQNFYDECAVEIQKILEITQGRAFILTTSYTGLEKLRALLTDAIPFPLLVQGDKPKSVIIDDFRRDVRSVLLATISFWQGVDVPGESLSAVIIDKLPFASPGDPLVKARVEFLKAQGQDPFYGFQVPNAIMMLKQGVGRLIRSKTDRGMITILDHRIQKMGYGRKFLRSLPGFSQTSDLHEVNYFFRSMSCQP